MIFYHIDKLCELFMGTREPMGGATARVCHVIDIRVAFYVAKHHKRVGLVQITISFPSG